MFDANTYFNTICTSNKIAAENQFRFCRISGLSALEEVITNLRTTKNFFCLDDSSDGTLSITNGVPMNVRLFSIYLFARYTINHPDQQSDALNLCRRIFHTVVTKLLHDYDTLSNNMIYLDIDRIPFREIDGYLINGCCGLNFIITVKEPTDLSYDPQQWQ